MVGLEQIELVHRERERVVRPVCSKSVGLVVNKSVVVVLVFFFPGAGGASSLLWADQLTTVLIE